MGAHIIMIDDNDDIRFVLSKILKNSGYRVSEASNGWEGFQKMGKEEPDLVILDIMMPDMNGWEICERIKADAPQIPVTMLSAKDGSDDIARSLEAGADRHLTKPIKKVEILRTVHDLLEVYSKPDN